MPRRKKHEEEHEVHLVHDESNWLVSYADMMTLLFGFFLLMFSLSRVDHEKFEVVRKDMVKYFGGHLKENPGALNLKTKVESIVQEFTELQGDAKELATAQIVENTLRLTFDSEFLFQSGSAELTVGSAQMVDKIAQELRKAASQEIEIEGHTDADPIRSSLFPSNWELSSARSARVVRRMIENGLDRKIMTAKGYAESRPAVPHYDSEGKVISENKVKNRRVVILVRLPSDKLATKKFLEEKGFREPANTKGLPSGANVGNFESNLGPDDKDGQKDEKSEVKDLKVKLEEAQRRFQEANEKLKSAQEVEKAIKEMENLRRKTEEVERKIQNVEKRAEETMSRSLPKDDGSRGE